MATLTKLKAQISDFETLAAKVGFDKASQQLGQQVGSLQSLVDSYLKRSSVNEQHYKATDADIKQLGAWYKANQQAIRALVQRINHLCDDIENQTITIKVEKAAPTILKQEFEKIMGVSVKQYVDQINIEAIKQALSIPVNQANTASSNAQLYAGWMNQKLQSSMLTILLWLCTTVVGVICTVGCMLLPGWFKLITLVVLAVYAVVMVISWIHITNK